MGFHRVVRRPVRTHTLLPVRNEFAVPASLDTLEVIPSSKVANERLGIETRQFLLTDRERHNRDVLSRDFLVGEF